ncbi:MAG: phage gp6-like head-tail connector protein [Patescibacteria group bacterium]|nr:phage gp6-like head-tail connector protein [Patescibacteria group bacterium]
MSLDTTLALVTLDEARRYLEIPEDDVSHDVMLEYLINAASQFIADHCRRKFITPTTAYDEYFEGDGTESHYTKYAPLTTTIANIYYWDGMTWQNLTGTTFAQDNDSGKLFFTDGGIFSLRTHRSYKISYKYGYAVAVVPSDLKLAVMELVAVKRKKFTENLHGESSKTFGDQTVTFSTDKIPEFVNEIVRKYRRLR